MREEQHLIIGTKFMFSLMSDHTVKEGKAPEHSHHYKNEFFYYTWNILWPLHASSTYLKSLYLELKALGQWGWEQWKGFSPVWQNAWSRSLSFELKRAPHTKHSFPLPLPSLSLSFSFSVSLSVLPAAGPPNTLVAPCRSLSSSVSVAIWCEASAAAAAMAALGCRCHWNSAVAALPSRLWFDIAATFKGMQAPKLSAICTTCDQWNQKW